MCDQVSSVISPEPLDFVTDTWNLREKKANPSITVGVITVWKEDVQEKIEDSLSKNICIYNFFSYFAFITYSKWHFLNVQPIIVQNI